MISSYFRAGVSEEIWVLGTYLSKKIEKYFRKVPKTQFFSDTPSYWPKINLPTNPNP